MNISITRVLMWPHLKNASADWTESFCKHLSQWVLFIMKFSSQNMEPLWFYEPSTIWESRKENVMSAPLWEKTAPRAYLSLGSKFCGSIWLGSSCYRRASIRIAGVVDSFSEETLLCEENIKRSFKYIFFIYRFYNFFMNRKDVSLYSCLNFICRCGSKWFVCFYTASLLYIFSLCNTFFSA
jgi:hypothetical protein